MCRLYLEKASTGVSFASKRIENKTRKIATHVPPDFATAGTIERDNT